MDLEYTAAGSRAATGTRSHGTTWTDPSQPTRSASTVAATSGVSFSSARTRDPNTTIDDSVGIR